MLGYGQSDMPPPDRQQARMLLLSRLWSEAQPIVAAIVAGQMEHGWNSRRHDAKSAGDAPTRGRHADAHVAAELGEEPQQPIAGKPIEPAVHERRNLRLADAEDFSSRGLSEPLAFYDLQNLGGKLGLGQRQTGIRNADVGEHIPAASLNSLRRHGVTLS